MNNFILGQKLLDVLSVVIYSLLRGSKYESQEQTW